MPTTKHDPEFLAQQVLDAPVDELLIKPIDIKANIEREREASDAFRETYDLLRDATLIARQLRDLRERRGLSQAEVAELAGTSQQVISRLEQPDYASHSLSMLRRVVGALRGRLVLEIIPEA